MKIFEVKFMGCPIGTFETKEKAEDYLAEVALLCGENIEFLTFEEINDNTR